MIDHPSEQSQRKQSQEPDIIVIQAAFWVLNNSFTKLQTNSACFGFDAGHDIHIMIISKAN